MSLNCNLNLSESTLDRDIYCSEIDNNNNKTNEPMFVDSMTIKLNNNSAKAKNNKRRYSNSRGSTSNLNKTLKVSSTKLPSVGSAIPSAPELGKLYGQLTECCSKAKGFTGCIASYCKVDSTSADGLAIDMIKLGKCVTTCRESIRCKTDDELDEFLVLQFKASVAHSNKSDNGEYILKSDKWTHKWTLYNNVEVCRNAWSLVYGFTTYI